MCGRFTLRAPASVVAEQFALFDVAPFTPRFNIAPTQPVAVVRATVGACERDKSLSQNLQGDLRSAVSAGSETHAEPGSGMGSKSGLARSGPVPSRTLDWLRWGLVPSWAKDPEMGSRMINARSETAADKPAFRAAMRRRRCLVVADGFYEWQKTGKKKQPYFIRMKDDRPFAFAGLWETWASPDGSEVLTCTLLTTGPNELMRPIHDRMPVIVSPGDYNRWLDPGQQEPAAVADLLRPYRAEAMEAYPVSTYVNSPTHDDPRCVETEAGTKLF